MRICKMIALHGVLMPMPLLVPMHGNCTAWPLISFGQTLFQAGLPCGRPIPAGPFEQVRASR
ncbi:hypothetical protein BTR14_00060 [Rhizobium rhizosphaerae]|uniref:Uncharacterized protein n=1 Tax=Xaviernesmea rhizosphaerae TaxID=1672749 RepID=A0ABX3PI73_9HYPH|nr:hypothetical protein BTR14_00060 [Xaviernesmea rhizosphaerae]